MPPTCKHKGKAIGEADCNCDGGAKIFECTLLSVPCISEWYKIRSVEINGTVSEGYNGVFCNGCDYRDPPVPKYEIKRKCRD